jgi:hypothetical protein
MSSVLSEEKNGKIEQEKWREGKIDVGFINLSPIRANHYLHQSVAVKMCKNTRSIFLFLLSTIDEIVRVSVSFST